MPDLIIEPSATVEFTVDRERRTIRGLAIPFGDVASSKGKRWCFAKGSLTWGAVKALENHDWRTAFGTVQLEEADDGIWAAIRVPEGQRGDEYLALCEQDPETQQAVYDGLSAGLADDITAVIKDGVHHATSGTIREVSVTPLPAFTRARITSVAASQTEGTPMTLEELEAKIAELEAKLAELTAADNDDNADEATTVTPEQFSALEAEIEKMKKMKNPVQPGPQFAVTEEPIYRLAGTERAPSGHDFAEDLLAAGVYGDKAALARVTEFTSGYLAGDTAGPTFVDTADVNEANPAKYRPDLFLGQEPTPASPLYDFFNKGSLADVTPFFHSKLDRANTNVGVTDHVEGTDPADDDLVTAAGATVTPTAVSGKVHVTREVADQGGTPQISGLIWAEFERSFSIARETKTWALVNASLTAIASLTAAIAAGANGQVAGQAIEAGLLKLQFRPDGSRFQKLFGQEDLYAALATYENADGEKRYPIINPQNKSGITGDKYSFIDIGGYRMTPAATLGASSANASNSLVADPNAVHVWVSGLRRLDRLNESVEGWDLGAFAYFAGLVYDATGLRKITYDPTA